VVDEGVWDKKRYQRLFFVLALHVGCVVALLITDEDVNFGWDSLGVALVGLVLYHVPFVTGGAMYIPNPISNKGFLNLVIRVGMVTGFAILLYFSLVR